MHEPSYLNLFREGDLYRRVEAAFEHLLACDVCPRACGANRLEGETGFCRVPARPMVSSFGPHFGEERVLVGRHGSGTVFFTYCNLGCIFCQNCDISHEGYGEVVSIGWLARMFLSLQSQGCHNLNLVTPTHQMPQILAALLLALGGDLPPDVARWLEVEPEDLAFRDRYPPLRIPLVYNCGGYESLETLCLLDGVVDIYMPDIKYADPDIAHALSATPTLWSASPDYVSAVQEALQEMHRQVGDLVIEDGLAVRGMLVRHLVLPGGLSGTRQVMRFLSERISKETYVNIMDQYRPCYRAVGHPILGRRLTREEYEEALQAARDAGLWRFAA